MIRHIVLLTLQPGVTPQQQALIVDGLEAMPALVGTIRSYVIGRDLGLGTGNADISVIAEFDDVAGYEAYRDHPDHQRLIAELIRPVLAGRSAIQSEC